MDENLFKAFDYGFTFDENTKNMDNIEDLYKEENPIQDDKCSECNIKYTCIDGMFVCMECGEVGDYEVVQEWIHNICMNRKKSRYVRNRYIRRRVHQYVHHKYVSQIVRDYV